ncbi:MAG: hypothetical protein KGP29_04465 [Proteobacteria bacterium]|nr:hypothetical protein [Pseudomonadota bacterium]
MQFNALELQKFIEEKRLIFGKKLEGFLLKKLANFSDFFAKIFATKSTAFFGSIIIIATSILTQSSRDLGHDSATYPEIAQKILDGGKYFYDFIESNLPLNFVLTMIPVLLAKFFEFNVFATAEIFWNLLGILSIYFSSIILTRSDLARDRTIFNLLILSFTAGFFWRVFTLQFNEFGTKTTYLLAILFPYISYHLLEEKNLKKIDQILIGFLAALLFCLKPHYGIFAIVFECAKIIKKRNFLSVFCLRNYVSLVVLIGYVVALFYFFPDYIDGLSKLMATYYGNAHNLLFSMFNRDLFPILLLIFLCKNFLAAEKILSQIFLPVIASALLILLELIGGLDQRFIFYSTSLPFVVLVIFFLIKNQFINWRRDWWVLLLILFLPQFDPQKIFFVALSLPYFWGIFAFLLWQKWRKFFMISWASKIYFTGFFFLIGAALRTKEFFEISFIFSSAILISLLSWNQKMHEKFFAKKELSRLSSSAIFLVLSYWISLNLAAIFNLQFYEDSYKFKSPNHFTSEVIKSIKHYSNKDESIISISSGIPGIYPMITYAGKKNELPFLQYAVLFNQINEDKNSGSEYVISRLKEELKSPKNKLVFVEIWHHIDDEKCSIEFLEYYFRDAEFKKIFLENYVFLTRITNALKPSPDLNIINRDAEVYIRK